MAQPDNDTAQTSHFNHENLRAYRYAIEFVSWCDALLEKVPKKFSVHDQLDRASTSIPLNIAEGNGKFSKKDRCRYLDIARSSALECAAGLDVVVAKKCVEGSEIKYGKNLLHTIVSMLVGLIRTFSKDD
ncbi:four helix bundle protein [bacterium]|nr:four helix bundle protein [bacterium]MCI0602553.1 four helix bundle protein [bacterium]